MDAVNRRGLQCDHDRVEIGMFPHTAGNAFRKLKSAGTAVSEGSPKESILVEIHGVNDIGFRTDVNTDE